METKLRVPQNAEIQSNLSNSKLKGPQKKSNYSRIRIMKVMQSVYNCQGTHKELRIIHQFELDKSDSTLDI